MKLNHAPIAAISMPTLMATMAACLFCGAALVALAQGDVFLLLGFMAPAFAGVVAVHALHSRTLALEEVAA